MLVDDRGARPVRLRFIAGKVNNIETLVQIASFLQDSDTHRSMISNLSSRIAQQVGESTEWSQAWQHCDKVDFATKDHTQLEVSDAEACSQKDTLYSESLQVPPAAFGECCLQLLRCESCDSAPHHLQ